MRRTSLASRSRLVLLAGAWLGALACGGPTTSLDMVEGATALADGSSGTEDETAASTGDAPLPGDAPPICGSGCTPILTPTWTYRGASGSHAVVEMLRDADGSLWLGIQRTQGGVDLAQLSREGELLWSAAPGLTCERCELTDIALHPSGDVLIGANDRTNTGLQEAVIARFDVTAREVAWVRSLSLDPGDQTEPRLGELAVLDDDRIVALRVNGFFEGEVIELLDLTADGSLRWQGYVSAQPGSGGSWPPLAVSAPTGEAVLAHAWWDATTEQMGVATSRFVPPYASEVSRVLLPLGLDDLAVDGAGRRLELARSEGTETITLVLTSRRSSDPERWTASLPLVSTSSTRAALAVGPDDQVYTAVRATPRALDIGLPYVVRLEVARWSVDGALRWQASRPLDIMATADPIEVVVDDEHGLIVGTVVQGQPYVERYEQTCGCP